MGDRWCVLCVNGMSLKMSNTLGVSTLKYEGKVTDNGINQ